MPLSFFLPKPGGGADRLVISFTPTGSKDDLIRAAAQQFGHALPSALEGLVRPLSHRVQTGGISIAFLHSETHSLDRRIAHRGGRSVIQIKRVFPHNDTSLFSSRSDPATL